MKLQQVKKWAVSQLTTPARSSQSPAVLEVNDIVDGRSHSHSKFFEVGPMGVGVLGHPFLGISYGMQEYKR